MGCSRLVVVAVLVSVAMTVDSGRISNDDNKLKRAEVSVVELLPEPVGRKLLLRQGERSFMQRLAQGTHGLALGRRKRCKQREMMLNSKRLIRSSSEELPTLSLDLGVWGLGLWRNGRNGRG